jgi:hypothetical protein
LTDWRRQLDRQIVREQARWDAPPDVAPVGQFVCLFRAEADAPLTGDQRPQAVKDRVGSPELETGGLGCQQSKHRPLQTTV